MTPPISGMKIDPKTGGVVNDQGRVSGFPRAYVTGWLKRGPVGIIGTNINDAKETALSVLQDKQLSHITATSAEINELFRDKLTGTGHEIFTTFYLCLIVILFGLVSWEQFRRLEDEEIRRGKHRAPPTPREKLISVQEQLSFIDSSED